MAEVITRTAISELKSLRHELEETLHKERAKKSKSEARIEALTGRLWAVEQTLYMWGDLEQQETLDEALKKGEGQLTPST